VQDPELRTVQDFRGQLKLVFERREKGVAFDSSLDTGQIQIRAKRQRLGINLAPAADEKVALVPGIINFLQPGGDLKSPASQQPQFRLLQDLARPLETARQHDGVPVRQRMAYRLESLAPHDKDVSQRHFAKKAEVLRQMPGNFSGATNHMVFAHRGNGFKRFHETGRSLWRAGPCGQDIQ